MQNHYTHIQSFCQYQKRKIAARILRASGNCSIISSAHRFAQAELGRNPYHLVLHYLAGNQRKECVGSGAADLVYPLYDHCQRRIDEARDQLAATGENTVDVSDDGEITFTLGSDRFYDVIDKLIALLGAKDGGAIQANNTDFDAELGGYMYIFSNRRSLFLTGELKAAQLLRDMNDMVGMVPFPKFDEAQEDYKTYVLERLFYLTIPNTCSDPERAALISEVITHESLLSVIPLYYDTVVEQKGLRNEDSIEMLDIMRRTRSTDIASLFGWDTTLKNNINNKIFAGDTNIASEIESQRGTVEGEIQTFLEFLDDENA